MKKKIEEVQKYFKNRILNNEYKVVKFDVHAPTINIDGFEFALWVANGAEHFDTYESTQVSSFMHLNFSESEKVECYASLKIRIDEHENIVGKDIKLKLYNELRDELGIKN